jgi:hypothetical protein
MRRSPLKDLKLSLQSECEHAACIRRNESGRDMARWLIGIGVALIIAGLMWPWIQKLGLGRLPGDIVIDRGNARIYIPVVTSIVVSVVLSIVLWLINRQ